MAAEVIAVAVRGDDKDGLVGQRFHKSFQVARAKAGVHQHGIGLANDEEHAHAALLDGVKVFIQQLCGVGSHIFEHLRMVLSV